MSIAMLTTRPIFMDERKSLMWEKAYDILVHCNGGSYVQCNIPPVKPKSGEVFLYCALDASKKVSL